MTSTTQHIGAAGELLVQYRLLKLGIDSARLTTDSGIDLVAYTPGSSTAVTIQVKTALADGAAGGRGKPVVGWNFPHDCKAQMLAFVKLSTDSVWLMTLAQPKNSRNNTPQAICAGSTGTRQTMRPPPRRTNVTSSSTGWSGWICSKCLVVFELQRFVEAASLRMPIE